MTEPDSHNDGLKAPDGSDDAVIIRSEEQLSVSTHRRPFQRARLSKRVEVREQTVARTVQLSREEVAIEYLPIEPDFDPTAAAQSPPAERWMVLYEQEVVVTTRWVARERVRLRVHSVTEDREIVESVRKEQIALDSDGHAGRRLNESRDVPTNPDKGSRE